jgi:hypothetical protein
MRGGDPLATARERGTRAPRRGRGRAGFGVLSSRVGETRGA